MGLGGKRQRTDHPSALGVYTKHEQFPSRRSQVLGKHGMMATSQPLAAIAGWDVATGIPTKEKLEELGIGCVARGIRVRQ